MTKNQEKKKKKVSDDAEEVSVEVLEALLADMTEQYKRAVADYANLQRKVGEERQTAMNLATGLVVTNLLPALDNLTYAAEHSSDDGLWHIVQQFRGALEAQGIKEIEALGVAFDPSMHEAVETIEGSDDNKIVEVTRVGYQLGDQVIRPAQVVVSTLSKTIKVHKKT